MAAMSGDTASADPPTRLPPVRVRNRRRVLRAARALVEKQGIEALTIRQLALEAEVSTASLYNLIGGRDEIVRALGMYFMEELDETFIQLKARTPLERARELLTAVADIVTQELPKSVLLAVFSDAQLYTNLIPSWQPSDALAGEIRTMVRAGMLTNDLSIPRISKEIWRIHMAYLRQWAIGSLDEDQLRAAVLYHLDLCLLAVATPASRKRLLAHARSLQDDLPETL
jgi:AcrR family transcriptional regulator